MFMWSASASDSSGVIGPTSRRTRPRLSSSRVRSVGSSGRSEVRARTSVTRLSLERAVGELLAPAALARADDRVADLGCAVAVLERGAVGGDVRVVGDRPEQMVELVHERVAPADDVARRPPELPERMVGLGDEDPREPARAAAVAEHLELVQP